MNFICIYVILIIIIITLGEYALSNLYQYHEMPQKRREYLALIGEIMDVRKRSHTPMAYVHTYGCQQNVADSEKIKADAQAYSIEVIQEQLNQSPEYIEYQKVQRWDGKLPQVMGENVNPFVSMNAAQ